MNRGLERPSPDRLLSLIILLAVENPQNCQEKIDNVQVERNCRRNLLFHMIVAHDELGVDQDVAAEDESGSTAVYQFRRTRALEEGRHKAEQYQDPQRSEEVRLP